MKNYMLGIVTMFILGFSFQVMWFSGLSVDNSTVTDIGYYGGEAIRGIYFVKPITNRCTTKKRCNTKGCFTSAQYFNCDKVQIYLNKLIHGEN